MKKYFLTASLIISILILSGCASASPRAINGKYYMGGDSNCRRYRVISDDKIMCMNIDGQDMGYRNAMSDQELEMYRFNTLRSDSSSRELNYQTQERRNRTRELDYETQQMLNKKSYQNLRY